MGLDFLTALGYGKDDRTREAVRHLISKRRPDGKWKLDHANGNPRLETPSKPSKIITFLSMRVMKRIGKS